MNSVSGGKTSAYMAYHFPADYNVFAAVCSENPLTAPKDAGLLREVSSKLERYNDQFGEFIGTKEDPLTLRVVLDLEQMVGQEIHWVRGETYEAFVRRKSALPNTEWRMCTTELKIRPIAEWIYRTTGGGKVFNRVGIRLDEAGRMKSIGHRGQQIDIIIKHKQEFILERIAELSKNSTRKILYASLEDWLEQLGGHPDQYKNKWLRDYEFAEAQYPLIEDGNSNIRPHRKADIYKWAYASGLKFPESSNCQDCFHKSVAELRRNCAINPGIMEAGAQMEEAFSAKKGDGKIYSMKKDFPLRKIIKMPPVVEWDLFSDASKYSCDSTFCTD